MRHPAKISATSAVMAFLCAAAVVFAASQALVKGVVDNAQLYGPIIGDWHAKKPKTFVFYWSAANQKSVDAYRTIVGPLIRKEDSNILVLLVQVLGDGVNDANGPGALLLCPRSLQDYVKLASGYLNNAVRVEEVKKLPGSQGKPIVFVTNSALDDAQRFGLFDPKACMTDEYFWSRLVVQLGENKRFFQRTAKRELPQVEIDGELMLPGDPRVTRFVKGAKAARSSR